MAALRTCNARDLGSDWIDSVRCSPSNLDEGLSGSTEHWLERQASRSPAWSLLGRSVAIKEGSNG